MADDIVDDVNVGTAFDLIGRKAANMPAPMACCPSDGEPLIFTCERPRAEFHCVVCGGWFGFLSPAAKDVTDELEARRVELKARFDAGVRGPS